MVTTMKLSKIIFSTLGCAVIHPFWCWWVQSFPSFFWVWVLWSASLANKSTHKDVFFVGGVATTPISPHVIKHRWFIEKVPPHISSLFCGVNNETIWPRPESKNVHRNTLGVGVIFFWGGCVPSPSTAAGHVSFQFWCHVSREFLLLAEEKVWMDVIWNAQGWFFFSRGDAKKKPMLLRVYSVSVLLQINFKGASFDDFFVWFLPEWFMVLLTRVLEDR